MGSRKHNKHTYMCPLGGIMNIISKKWALLIINVVGNTPKVRYNEIMERLEGINSKTLSDRLKELEEYGLIRRKAYAEIPPRVEYSLTSSGVELRRALLPLMRWGYSHNSVAERTQTPCDVAYKGQ